MSGSAITRSGDAIAAGRAEAEKGMVTQDLAVGESVREDVAVAGTWRADSECRRHPTRWWFNGDHRETALAKSICSGCVVQEPCLEFALTRPDMFGIWAATTANERAAIRREARAEPKDVPAPRFELSVARPEPVVPPVFSPADARVGVRADPRVDDADLLTPAEAARKLGVTPNTVTRWSRAGRISAIQTMGGHRRFRRDEIERVLRECGPSASLL
jgi:excisionase family DNA binding protein